MRILRNYAADEHGRITHSASPSHFMSAHDLQATLRQIKDTVLCLQMTGAGNNVEQKLRDLH